MSLTSDPSLPPGRPSTSNSPQHALFWAIALMVGAAYAADFARYAPAALQDFPNHLARAALIDDLAFHAGHAFGQAFEFQFMAVPYFLHDLLFASAIELLGIQAGAMAWVALVLLSLPCALVLYARAMGLRSEDNPLLFLIGLYIATSAAFCRGFLAYCLALSVTLLALAAAQSWRERGSALAFVGYCAALCCGYFIHLTALVFIAAALAVLAALRAMRRELRMSAELALLTPIAVLLAWHVGHGQPNRGVLDWKAYHWAGLPAKLRQLDWAFIRFDRRIDHFLLGLGLLWLLAQAWARRSPASGDRAHRVDMLALAAAFFALYIALPNDVGILSWLDVRALPMMAIFLVLALIPRSSTAAPAPETARGGAQPPATPAEGKLIAVRHAPFAIALALAAANLAYLHHKLGRFDGWLSSYRDIVAAVPTGAWVLPVYTNTRDRPVKSTLHAAANTFLERHALNPYLFSRDQGDAMPYFAYRKRPYAPDEYWYLDPTAEKVDWEKVADSYHFLLVMKPYDPARIPIETTPMLENSAAALLQIGTRASMNLENTVH